jgi:holo-[acyl-carrier-protein] synthase
MIYGIGTDIVEIERIKNVVEKWGDRFLKKVFTGKEIEYCYNKKDPFPHLAARFAAKEAFIKASSALRVRRLEFHAIEILSDPSGRPFIKILTPDSSLLTSDFFIHLTLSHERNYTIAIVVIETKK